MGIELDVEGDAGPWVDDLNKLSSFVGLNIGEEGRLTLVDGGEVTVPTPTYVLPGKPLLAAGTALSHVQDDGILGDPIIAASNGYGDIVLATCEACSVQVLMAGMSSLKPTSMVLLGVGSIYAITSPGEGDWIATISHDELNTKIPRLRLMPGRIPPRAFATEFKTQTTRKR